jgi:hypothetical protein
MTQELTTINILSLFETNKAQRASFVNDVVDRLESGSINPLNVHLQVKAMEDVVKLLNDNKVYKSIVLDAAEKNGKKFSYQSAEFSTREVGVKYDYSQCNDTELNDLQQQAEAINAKLKTRQEFIKSLPIEGIDVITTEGEVTRIYPPAKSSTTSVVVTLK